jgi:hypothetical protein
VVIGLVPNPREWDRWPDAEALLEPARKLADNMDTVLDDGELLWVVMDGDELVAAITTRMTTEKHWEVLLIGGRDHRSWVPKLNILFGAASAEAGATHMVALGRRGWLRELKRLGWAEHGVVDGMTVFSREV